MNLPTDSQWARYSALCARLRPVPAAERAAALQALRAQGADDPQVLSLVAVHFALPPDPDRLRTGERVGQCTLEEPLGAGGMGVVYRAQQHLGPARRPVAVKLIHPALLRAAPEEALAQFLAELHTLVTLQHEGIARIYDGGIHEDPRTHDQLPYLVMELVHGGLPITTYAKDYALSWPERLALFVRVCRAVQYAHEHRVVHRDLKPANMLVDPEGRPVVIDFGLACAYDALLPGAHVAAAGTPAYMSPEQVSDRFGPISTKSDVYALGLILYELLTEQLPYVLPRDGAVEELCQVIIEAMQPPLSQHNQAYGRELDALVAAALAKQPAARVTVAVLRSRLERYLQQLPPDRNQPRLPTTQHGLDQASAGLLPPPVQPAQSTDLPPAAGTSRGLGTAGYVMPDAERRQLTIMFCDLVDSTYIAGQRDPEDWREVVRAYQQTCEEVIQSFDGYIAQWLGDGLLVYFGWPQAHEDDALRAVRTGLGLLEAMGPLNTRLAHAHGLRLALRVGIHTGLVVVGEMGGGGRQERLALGDTPNIASRVQGLATPDTVVISAATFHLVEGYFTVEDLGRQAVKGVVTPLQVYQVVGASAAQSRLEVAAAKGLTPLVGRDAEVALLCERWAQSRDGQGQVVLLCGEAGIGKSRLVEVLTAHVRSEGALRMMFRCSPYHTHSPFFPVIAHLQRLLRWHQDEAPEARVTKLEQALRPYGFALQDVVPLFAALLSVPLPEHYPPLMLSPQRQKQKTQEALVAWLLAEAERQPVLAVWEDLHWADPTTREWLGLVLDQTPTVPLCHLLTCRPEFRPPWAVRSYLTHLALGRLSAQQTEGMIRRVVGDKRLPTEVVQQIVAKTDGVPLFVEELTKTVLESGLLQEHDDHYALTGPLRPLAIPATLQDALMARLDRLADGKSVAQLGAVLGRTFAYELLQAVSPREEMMLQQGLSQLVEAELLYQRGVPPHAQYMFKHALIQEVAYQSLLRSTRQQYHQRTAQVMVERFPDLAETQPERLAHHYTQAGLHEQAIAYWQQAAQCAFQRSAYAEAVAHLTEGLEVLTTLPATPERNQHELDLQILLGRALLVTKGCPPEAEHAFARARALCQQGRDTPQRFSVLHGLQLFYLNRAELQIARELGEQLLSLAHSLDNAVWLMWAHGAWGLTCYWLGALPTAHRHLEQSIGRYNAHTQQHRRATTLSNMAEVLWLLGYPTQALRKTHEAIIMAQEQSDIFDLALTLGFALVLYVFRREERIVHERAEAAMTLAAAHEFAQWVAQDVILQGWALAEQGHAREGVAQMRQGLAAWRESGAEITRPFFLALLATGYQRMGQIDQALHLLQEALALVDATGERWCEADLHRLKGELLLRLAADKAPEAEACFQQALDVARRQQAKSWELRAAMSLSRLWQQQGKQAEAHALLLPIYGWFTEGFDTADLQEAKALLEVLPG